MLMENFLRSKEYWHLVEDRVPAAAEGDTAKDIWDSLKQKYHETTRVKHAQLQALRKDFEILHMKTGETMNEFIARTLTIANKMKANFIARTLTIANKMKANGEDKGDAVVVEKILRSMTPKFNYVVCSIEESKDTSMLTIDELQSSLLVHEQRMNSQNEEEHALKVSHGDHSGGRGRGNSRGRGQGRGRQSFDKSTIECYRCHNLGLFQWECSQKEKEVHFVEAQEEMLLMAYLETNIANKEDTWFLDSGCIVSRTPGLQQITTHGGGKKEYFFEILR
ncbi:uncharacterized protein LOC119371384 [Jatropha curcas]|uniref:uncharacterized protein LOC119371384 n=1 Tax=Jatropha curcas TaxID=180498 RepID=UPI0018953691|nr:uncharacterized protein LOC119371384 [Jatropha curcas]